MYTPYSTESGAPGQGKGICRRTGTRIDAGGPLPLGCPAGTSDPMAALMRLQRAAWTHLGDRDALGGAMLRAYETCDACISENRLFRGADEIQRLAAAIEAAVEGDRPDRPEAEEPFQIDTRLLRRGTSRG